MTGFDWSKDRDRRLVQRGKAAPGTDSIPAVEDKAAAPSKDTLRREADRLLAGYSGPVTKIPASNRYVNSSQASRKPKRDRPQDDLFGGGRKHDHRVSSSSRAVPPGLVIYCDGACEPNPGAGGWGFVVYRDGVEIRADCGGSISTTNNIMELTGALMALRWLDDYTAGANLLGPQNARLLCDSRYVVNGCNTWRHGWKARGWRRKGKNPEIASLDLWKELDTTLAAVLIELEWCKGHAGIVGNERADELSQQGRETILSLQTDPLDQIRQQLDYSARSGW
jgi:ribonuclease HI